MELETLRNELNLANTECHMLRRQVELVTSAFSSSILDPRPLHRIVAQRIALNLQTAAFGVCGVAGIVVNQVKRVKLPRLRVDWQ